MRSNCAAKMTDKKLVFREGNIIAKQRRLKSWTNKVLSSSAYLITTCSLTVVWRVILRLEIQCERIARDGRELKVRARAKLYYKLYIISVYTSVHL